MPLPDFLIIGAGRSGTTTLYEILRQHAQIFMPEVKEPNYFAFADGTLPEGPGAAWLRATSLTTRARYEALFANAGDARAIGEASPRYMISAEAAARIHATIPAVRLIAILRHPVERAYANYLAYRRDGVEPAASFEAALADQERRRHAGWPFGAFVDFGFQHRQLARYDALFPARQLRIYLYDDLLRDAAGLVRDVLGFLEVDASWRPDLAQRHGRTGVIRNPLLAALWRHSQRARSMLGPCLPHAWRNAAYGWLMRDLVKPEMKPETRAALLRLYRADTLALQERLGRDLSAWLR